MAMLTPSKGDSPLRLGILVSHPIQYYAPIFRELASIFDLRVVFAHRQTAIDQARAGFNVGFEWDVDLLAGYEYEFLDNISRRKSTDHFFGCDTPAIDGVIRRSKFDAFVVMGWYLKSHWQAVISCKRHGVPVLVRGDSQLGTRRSWFRQALKGLIYPYLLKCFDSYLYVGKKNREYLIHYGVPERKLFFSPHCVDNDFFSSISRGYDKRVSRRRLGIEVDATVALFVGKMLEIKRPHDLIGALALLRAQGVNAQAVMVGDGMLRTKIEEAARAAGVPTIFLGFLNQTELPEAYVLADVTVLPSSSETWGLVVNESLACGTPVVVSNAVGCSDDLVKDGVTGVIYSVGDIQGLAQAIERASAIPSDSYKIMEVIDAYSASAAALGMVNAIFKANSPENNYENI